ncbi:MAG: CDP-diacylglycerol--glycerol-3-phosphate 3-phosphatidyltransferase [Synechococcales cyanobacterium]
MLPPLPLATWITFSRLLGIPVILYGLSLDSQQGDWLTGIVFVVAALTDWVDGYVARRFNQVTDLGKFLDPLVDKLLILTPLLCFVEKGMIPAWGVFLIVARELTVAGWRVNQVQITGASRWGKVKTVVQSLAVVWLLTGLPGGIPCFWLAVAITLWSGWLYLRPQAVTEKSS